MSNFVKRQFLVLMITVTLSLLGACVVADSAEMEVLDIESSLKRKVNDSCTDYELKVRVAQNTTNTTNTTLSRCLTSGPNGKGRQVLVLAAANGERARITRGVYRVFKEFDTNGGVVDVVHVPTLEIPFELAEYLSIRLPNYEALGGRNLCAVSALGVLPISTFKKVAIERMKRRGRFERSSLLEGVVKDLQPWCQNRKGQSK